MNNHLNLARRNINEFKTASNHKHWNQFWFCRGIIRLLNVQQGIEKMHFCAKLNWHNPQLRQLHGEIKNQAQHLLR